MNYGADLPQPPAHFGDLEANLEHRGALEWVEISGLLNACYVFFTKLLEEYGGNSVVDLRTWA